MFDHGIVRTSMAAVGIVAALLLNSAPAAALESLPVFHAPLDQTSVSGLSGGGFMAVQFSVAYSSLVRGAGIIAGGPYYCAQGSTLRATSVCSCTGLPVVSSCKVGAGAIDVDRLIEFTDRSARDGAIDPVAGMARQKIWMFSGKADSVVPQPVMDDLQRYYRHYAGNSAIRYHQSMPAQHAIPTDSYGNDCGKLGLPFINNCGFDGVGDMLRWIHGEMKPRNDGPASGRLLEFGQAEFVGDRQPAAHGMANSGFLYIPQACATAATDAKSACKVHIAFHGCKQDAANVQQRFVRNAGYNRWADTNRMLVLYPQAAASVRNPNACWNWFDFDQNDPHYADKKGVQMRAVKAMLDRVAGTPTSAENAVTNGCFTSSNFEHVMAGRAKDRFFIAWAKGSNQMMGFDNIFFRTTLKQTGPDTYVVGSCDR
jgi:poly(3-hydroxybutyrate) depolymerase